MKECLKKINWVFLSVLLSAVILVACVPTQMPPPSSAATALPTDEKCSRSLSVEETVWDAAGDLDASLHKKGITIPPMDVIIAQVCLHHKVFLFTLDEHFRSIPGLKVFEP